MAAAVSRLALLAALMVPAVAQAQATEHAVALDIFAFSQGDGGGDPHRSEGFDYFGLSLDLSFQLHELVRLLMVGTVGYIDNDPIAELPETVGNRAELTSASAEIVTLDAATTVEIQLPGSDWTLAPGFYYHHQHGYIVFGGDLGARVEVADGDAILAANYSFRGTRPIEPRWDDSPAVRDRLLTHNLLFSWTQTLSPAWLMTLSGQYTRQDGLLHSPLQYVTAVDFDGRPVSLSDEVLPRTRNRGQFNAELRWSPALGWAIGLAGSVYGDDWQIVNGTVQPSAVFPLPGGVRWRLWYQFTGQHGTKYFNGAAFPHEFETQDSDLGFWLMHSPGMTLTFPFGSEPQWTIRVSGYGFYRSDGIYGGGARAGVVASW